MIKLIKSSFYNEDDTKKKLAEFVINADRFSMGTQCALFEEQFAKKQQRKHAVFVSSGSMANLVLIQSLLNSGKLAPGARVGVSSLTWATNVMPLLQLGLEPVMIDCELSNLNISQKILSQVENLDALFITNVLGFAADINAIATYCKEKNILLFEDNCESLGSVVAGTLLGNFGIASTFSTYIGHHLSTIEGGLICTDDDELYEMLLTTRAHGWDRNLPVQSQRKLRDAHGVLDDFFAWYTFYDLAYNARPTEIHGFIGVTQISYWDDIVEKRQQNFMNFIEVSSSNDDIYPLDVAHMEVVSNFSMPLVMKTPELCERYKRRFQNSSIEIRPIIAGNIARQPFFKKYSKEEYVCPNADTVHEQGFYFGNNPDMSEKEVSILCDLLRK